MATLHKLANADRRLISISANSDLWVIPQIAYVWSRKERLARPPKCTFDGTFDTALADAAAAASQQEH